MNPPVFIGAGATVGLFVIFGSIWTEQAGEWFEAARVYVSKTFGWFYLVTATGFLIASFILLFSKAGKIKLGKPDDEPEYSLLGWLTMLFAAGMGTGLVFWGVAEPLHHYSELPMGGGGEPSAIGDALRWSFFHWGLHPWAIYSMFGIAISYFHFRHGLPLAPRSIFFGLTGRPLQGALGHVVDAFCTVGTLMGVATSLGLGAMQINQGLGKTFGVEQAVTVQIWLIVGITAVATISVALGVSKGIQRLSIFNIGLGGVLLLFVLLVGPTLYLVEAFISGTAQYIQRLPFMSLWIDLREGTSWQANWTLFYWGWWFSWCPFVGIFTARISRGRTIREFLIAVLVVPVLGAFVWMSVFGGTALHLHAFGGAELVGPVREEVAISLHLLLEELPWASITAVLATLLVTVFFITSSDSGSLVDDMVTAGGDPHPPRWQRIFWATSEGAVAAVLLLAGGLRALQNAALTMGFPMAVILAVGTVSLFRALIIDSRRKGVSTKAIRKEAESD
jgi:choline/glycine/proline betaine transport protein